MFIRLVFIAFCLQFHWCGSVQVSKYTISRITFAIKCFQEQESKRIFILREWPAMQPTAGKAEKNLSVDAYTSPPILIFDILTCYGDVMKPLCCPVCLKSGHSSTLRPTGLWTDGTTRCVYEPRVVYDVSCSLLLVLQYILVVIVIKFLHTIHTSFLRYLHYCMYPSTSRIELASRLICLLKFVL